MKISTIFRYFFPKRKLHRVPKQVTALYDRTQLTYQQAIVMMAGLARDPEKAQQIFDELYQQHGKDTYKHIKLQVLRNRTSSPAERFMRLMRFMFGEHEHDPTQRQAKQESVVLMDYGFRDDE